MVPSISTITARFGSGRAAMTSVGANSAAGDETRGAVASWFHTRPAEPQTSASGRRAALRDPHLPSLSTVAAKLLVDRSERATSSGVSA